MQEKRIEALKEKASYDPNLRLLSMHSLGSKRRPQAPPRSHSGSFSPHASTNSAHGLGETFSNAGSPSSSRFVPLSHM